jgi:hypothetical protein
VGACLSRTDAAAVWCVRCEVQEQQQWPLCWGVGVCPGGLHADLSELTRHRLTLEFLFALPCLFSPPPCLINPSLVPPVPSLPPTWTLLFHLPCPLLLLSCLPLTFLHIFPLSLPLSPPPPPTRPPLVSELPHNPPILFPFHASFPVLFPLPCLINTPLLFPLCCP